MDEAGKTEEKRQEARLRRMAAGMGLALRKSRTRDPMRMDFGRYRIEDIENGCVVAGRFPYGYTLGLYDVAEVLEEIELSRDERKYAGDTTPGHPGAGPFDAKWG